MAVISDDLNIQSCYIIFNELFLTAGKSTKAAVILQLSDLSIFDTIFIEIKGVAECKWSTRTNKTFSKIKRCLFKKCNKTYYGCKQFYKHVVDVLNISKENLPYVNAILPGIRKYLFEFTLDPDVPGTWNGILGSIQYTMTVVIQRTKYDNDKKVIINQFSNTINVLVRGVLDLDKYKSKLRQAVTAENSRSFCKAFLIPFGGTINVTLWTPMSGVIPGQQLPLLILIKNNSEILISNLITVLTMIESYNNNRSKNHHIRRDVCRLISFTNVIQDTAIFFCMLKIPMNLPLTYNFKDCNICQIYYELWASVQVALPKNFSFGYTKIDTPSIPIVVGSHPYNNWNYNKIIDDIKEYINSLHKKNIHVQQLNNESEEHIVEQLKNN